MKRVFLAIALVSLSVVVVNASDTTSINSIEDNPKFETCNKAADKCRIDLQVEYAMKKIDVNVKNVDSECQIRRRECIKKVNDDPSITSAIVSSSDSSSTYIKQPWEDESHPKLKECRASFASCRKVCKEKSNSLSCEESCDKGFNNCFN